MTRVRVMLAAVVGIVGSLLGLRSLGFIPPMSSIPRLDCPTEILLGEHEIGSVAIGRFEMANCGHGELVIQNVSTNCSCTGLEEERDGKYVRVDRLTLQPGERIPLIVRVSVRGFPIGSQGMTKVNFSTNDPNHPHCELAILLERVKGGVHPIPNTAVFGRMGLNTPHKRIVHIFDDALTPRSIESIRSSDPERVQVRLLPANPATLTVEPAGTHLADAEITARSATADTLNATVYVTLKNETRTPDPISVTGLFVAELDLAPSTIRLPVRSGGELIYDITCVCRSTSHRQFKLTARPTTDCMVTIQDAHQFKQSHQIQISVSPARTQDVKFDLTLDASFDNGTRSSVQLPVLVKTVEKTP